MGGGGGRDGERHSDNRKRINGCLPMTNGNAKFTRIMINDSSSYSRVIRLTGKGASDAAAFFEPWRIVIPEALNFRINRRGSVTFNARSFQNFIVCIFYVSLFFIFPTFLYPRYTRSPPASHQTFNPDPSFHAPVKFLIYILHRFRAHER